MASQGLDQQLLFVQKELGQCEAEKLALESTVLQSQRDEIASLRAALLESNHKLLNLEFPPPRIVYRNKPETPPPPAAAAISAGHCAQVNSLQGMYAALFHLQQADYVILFAILVVFIRLVLDISLLHTWAWQRWQQWRRGVEVSKTKTSWQIQQQEEEYNESVSSSPIASGHSILDFEDDNPPSLETVNMQL